MNQASNIKDKNRSTDIILVLKPVDGEKPKSVTGLVDPRLFTGENRLHAIMNTQTCLWHLAYDNGILPGALKQQWTGWDPLYKFTTAYFKRRNIEIVEVID